MPEEPASTDDEDEDDGDDGVDADADDDVDDDDDDDDDVGTHTQNSVASVPSPRLSRKRQQHDPSPRVSCRVAHGWRSVRCGR